MDVSNRDPALQWIFYVTVLFASVPCLADVSWNSSQPETTSSTSLLISSLQTGFFAQNARHLTSQQPPSSILHTTTSPVLQSLRKSTEPVELCLSEKPHYSSKPEIDNRTFPSSLNASNFNSDLENVTKFQQESNSTRLRSQEIKNITSSKSKSTHSGEQLWPNRKQKDSVRSNSDSRSHNLKRKISVKVGNQSFILNGSQFEREPVAANSASSLSKVNEKKVDDQLALSSYLEAEGYGDNTNYDDDQGYPDQGFGSDEYGMFGGDNVEKRRNGQHQELFRDYEELQDEPLLIYNYTNPSLTKRKDAGWSRDRRIEYDGLYDLHLMQEIPDGSSVIRRIVSLSGRLSSERINVSLVVIYGWLGLVILMIITALIVLKYKQKLSTVCSRASNACRLTSGCHRVSGFEEGNNLLAHPLV